MKQWRVRFLPSSTNTAKALLMKSRETILEAVTAQEMEERVISGHTEDSPEKHLSNLRLKDIDITKK